MSDFMYFDVSIEAPDGEVETTGFMVPDWATLIGCLKSYKLAGWQILSVWMTVPGIGRKVYDMGSITRDIDNTKITPKILYDVEYAMNLLLMKKKVSAEKAPIEKKKVKRVKMTKISSKIKSWSQKLDKSGWVYLSELDLSDIHQGYYLVECGHGEADSVVARPITEKEYEQIGMALRTAANIHIRIKPIYVVDEDYAGSGNLEVWFVNDKEEILTFDGFIYEGKH